MDAIVFAHAGTSGSVTTTPVSATLPVLTTCDSHLTVSPIAYLPVRPLDASASMYRPEPGADSTSSCSARPATVTSRVTVVVAHDMPGSPAQAWLTVSAANLAGLVTANSFTSVSAAVPASTLATAVNRAWSPAGSVGIIQSMAPPAWAALPVAETNVSPAGSRSVAATLAAPSWPLFLTVIVYVSVSPWRAVALLTVSSMVSPPTAAGALAGAFGCVAAVAGALGCTAAVAGALGCTAAVAGALGCTAAVAGALGCTAAVAGALGCTAAVASTGGPSS